MQWFLRILLVLICSEAYALPFGNQYSFAPPPSDLSVIYLSNIFGVVDGVLSGTGSQIFGRMMGVFNASLLALGSMLLIYTIIVGTLYTAHEGEFLGRQWSSIWIPLRSVLGVSLLVPKASGYSMIQIIVMWVVIQGVGAADKVWNAALDYLNAGGTIIQAQTQTSPTTTGVSSNPNYIGAATILTGQVCMLGLQNMIQDKHSQLKFLASGDTPTGPCNPNSDTYNDWQAFCTTDVPDFLGTVNFVDVQKNDDIGKLPQNALDSHSVTMPNFSSSAIPFYRSLNGVCGTVQWNSLASSMGASNATALASNTGALAQTLQPSQLNNIFLTRPIAIQQMYDNLSVIALLLPLLQL
jgi:defect-in-organelle-trafficking protein DotA